MKKQPTARSICAKRSILPVIRSRYGSTRGNPSSPNSTVEATARIVAAVEARLGAEPGSRSATAETMRGQRSQRSKAPTSEHPIPRLWAALKKFNWLVLGTWALVLGTLAAVGISWCALRNAQKALTADERARIAPTGASLDDTVRVGKELRIRIFFVNTGKEPAMKVVHVFNWSNFNISKDTEGEPFINLQEVAWPINDTCSDEPDPFGRPIYPHVKYKDIKYAFTGGNKRGKIPQSLIDKTSSLVIWGCFVYEMSEGVGWSPYCLYLQPHRTKQVDQWTFEFCPSGSAKSQQQGGERFEPSTTSTPASNITLKPDRELSQPK